MASVTQSDHEQAIGGWKVFQTTYAQVVSSEPTVRRPIWVAPYRVELGEVAFINSTVVTGASTNYVKYNLIDGGAEGAGTSELANRDLASGTDLPLGKTLLLDATSSGEVFMTQGDILELETEEQGTGLGSDINEILLYVVYRSSNLSS